MNSVKVEVNAKGATQETRQPFSVTSPEVHVSVHVKVARVFTRIELQLLVNATDANNG